MERNGTVFHVNELQRPCMAEGDQRWFETDLEAVSVNWTALV